MPTALPAPNFLATLTAKRRADRDARLARVRDKTFMGITHELGMACGEALNQAVACTPRMRQLYRQRPEVRADLRRRWRRAFEQARARQREVTILEARRDPNAFVELVTRAPSRRQERRRKRAWQDFLPCETGIIYAAVENAMSGQLRTYQKLWIAQELARNPDARMTVVGLE